MCKLNETEVTEFLLLGFKNTFTINILLFSFVLLVYIAILFGNILIILLVSISHLFHVPMYIFLKHLALADLLFTTNIIPNMLYIIIQEHGVISVHACFFQYYFHSLAIFTQSLILLAMSFDWYLAICQPLRYSSLMEHRICFGLVFCSWATGLILIPSEIALLFQLRFCGTNTIDHFFCDIAPILRISTSDVTVVMWEDFAFAILIIFRPFVLISISYMCIFFTIFKISSSTGRQKTFSTCSSHLVTVCTYYGTLIAIYMVPAGENNLSNGKLLSLLYTVLTPFINPLLYSIRNKEIKRFLKKQIRIHVF
ncbi:PREDICTED: olfactory receptor 10A7-like [Nanorana parkeri]|uniref:olfactory receptor 10A7-like n=1 Tax=Nanorana parkeri TaxID=125878 RepID=UPI0008544929|nr:PREDICTED: olfactory receptor 10A7-like [Nanorana parkeri]